MASITVSLSSEEKALLDQIASVWRRSDEELASEALREYLRFETVQVRKVEEGIAAADRGEFITDEELEAFFARYADH